MTITTIYDKLTAIIVYNLVSRAFKKYNFDI